MNKQFIVDESKPSSQARFGQLTNWIQCQTDEGVEEPDLIKKPSYYNLDHTTEELQEQKMGRVISSTSEFDGIE